MLIDTDFCIDVVMNNSSDTSTFSSCLRHLKYRSSQLTPLCKELEDKGINFMLEFPELYVEYISIQKVLKNFK